MSTIKPGMIVVCIVRHGWSKGSIFGLFAVEKPGPKYKEELTVLEVFQCDCGCGRTGLSFVEYGPGEYYPKDKFRPKQDRPSIVDPGVMETLPKTHPEILDKLPVPWVEGDWKGEETSHAADAFSYYCHQYLKLKNRQP